MILVVLKKFLGMASRIHVESPFLASRSPTSTINGSILKKTICSDLACNVSWYGIVENLPPTEANVESIIVNLANISY